MTESPLRFKFNAKKAAQAAGKLLSLSGGERNYMELLKLLYLADRLALVQLGAPITGDRFYSLPHGPVLSRILNLINHGPINENDAPWFDVVSPPVGYDVKQLRDIGEDELSNAEARILLEVFSSYGNLDWKELSRFTHGLPEWIDPGMGSHPISVEQVLLLSGKSDETIRRIKQNQRLFEQLDREIESYELVADFEELQ